MAELYTGSKPDSKVPLNGFDYGGRDVMTFQLGALYPIWNKSVIPHEKLRINVNHILRTFPMTSPNFNRNRAHFDFYFVPYSQIWKYFDREWTGKVDRQRVTEPAVTTSLKNAPQFDIIAVKKAMADEAAQVASYRRKDIHGYDMYANAFRLFDLLGYGSVPGYETIDSTNLTAWKNSFGDSGVSLYLNVFKIAAYQKIWANYYRDSIHDVNDYSPYFNFDDVVNTTQVNNIASYRSSAQIRDMFMMRYRQYKKDILTGSYASPQFGDVSSLTFSNIIIRGSDVDDTYNPFFNGDDLSYTENENFETRSNFNIPNAFDVYQFYRAEAVQLWRERALRAGNRYKDNYKAHFGVEPHYLEDDYPRFLGSFSTLIQIDDVVDTSSSGLGDLAGKGIATDQSKTMDFETNDFGVVMCMFSIVPEMDYNATGIDKDNFASAQEDFVIPEFDRLGMSPITLKEFNSPSYYGSPASSLATMNRILGYGPRWYEHKTRVNKVHGRFQYNVGYGQNGGYNGDLSKFVQPMQIALTAAVGDFNTLMELGTYYINPNVADTMFSVNSDGTEATDRFFGAIQVNCDELAPMSKLGVHAI